MSELQDNNEQLKIKATILRPLADKFQELTRKIDSGKYNLPKTIKEAEIITENYVNQAWERLEALIKQHDKQFLESIQAELPATDRVHQMQYKYKVNKLLNLKKEQL